MLPREYYQYGHSKCLLGVSYVPEEILGLGSRVENKVEAPCLALGYNKIIRR